MTIEIKVSTQADVDADDAATLRDAAEVLRRQLPDAVETLTLLESAADLLDPIEPETANLNFDAVVWDEAIEAARHYLDTRREAGGAYGQQDRRPSNYGRAARDLLNVPNPYRKADQ